MALNVENILKVADAIEQHSIPDLGFSMGIYGGPETERDPDLSGHNCGTVACIAGWTDKVLTGREPTILSPDYAEELLGIGRMMAISLFMPNGWSQNIIKPARAVAVLRHLAATGKVDWSIIDPTAN